MAALVVVDAGLTGCIDQDFGDHARGSLRGAPDLDEGHEERHEERDDESLQKAHEGVGIASPRPVVGLKPGSIALKRSRGVSRASAITAARMACFEVA